MRQKALIAFVLAIWGCPYVYAQEEGPELLDESEQLDPEIHDVFQQSVFGIPPKDAPPDYNESTEDPWWKWEPEDGEEEEHEEESEPEPPSTPPSSTTSPSSTPTLTMDNMYYKIKSWEGLNAKKLGSAKEVFKNKNQSYKNINHETVYTQSLLEIPKSQEFVIAPEEVAEKILNEMSAEVKESFKLPDAEVCIDAAKKMSELAYGMYKDGYEAYGDEIVYVGKETIKIASKSIPLVAAYDKSVNIWKFTTGRDLSFNPLPIHEQLAAGSALLQGLVPYPETALTWLVKYFNQEIIKDFLRRVSVEINKDE